MSLALPMLHDRDRVNIVEPGRLHPAVSFARASTATYMGPAGALLTAAANAPRYEYDGLGNYLGLLIEEARTNLLKYSNDFTNAAWSKSVGGTGTAPVITPNYGTAPDGSMTAARVVFSQGASTTGNDYSLLQQIATGSPNVPTNVTIYARSTTGAAQKLYVDVTGTNPNQAVTLGATWVRVGVYSSTGTSQRMDIGIRGNIGISTSDVMLAFAQLESASFATSYIPTTSTAVTRSADVANVSNLALIGYNVSAGSMLATVSLLDVLSFHQIASFDDGTINNRISPLATQSGSPGGGPIMFIASGGVISVNALQAAPRLVAGLLKTCASSWDATGATIVSSGGTPAAFVGAVTLPAVPKLYIGARGTANLYTNGRIKSLTYYPRRLPNSELQRLTT